jgi:hypothetical protein
MQLVSMFLCQLFLDRIDMQPDGWFKTIRAGKRRKIPAGGTPSTKWRPVLSDSFDSPTLEGVDGGVLGSKWLFKDEHTELWSLSTHPGSLTLLTNETGIEGHQGTPAAPRNLLLQRPTAAYYTLDTKVTWNGDCDASNTGAHAGLIARELSSGSGGAVGLWCDGSSSLPSVAFWQDTANRMAVQRVNSSEIYLKLDVNLMTATGWWSYDNRTWQGVPCTNWPKSSPNWRPGDAQCAGADISYGAFNTVLGWEVAHVDKKDPPSHGVPTHR